MTNSVLEIVLKNAEEAHSDPLLQALQPKEGLRFNKGKIDLTQLSWIAQYCESLVFMYGEMKYARNNYKFLKQDNEDGTGEDRALLEFIQCIKRHIMAYEQGEFFDKESKLPHMAHVLWNASRIIDVYYLGNTHTKDGKDWYHQPLRHDLPPVPTLENFESIWGFVPNKLKNKKKESP